VRGFGKRDENGDAGKHPGVLDAACALLPIAMVPTAATAPKEVLKNVLRCTWGVDPRAAETFRPNAGTTNRSAPPRIEAPVEERMFSSCSMDPRIAREQLLPRPHEDSRTCSRRSSSEHAPGTEEQTEQAGNECE
jgi:hypothetical protein